ncbi:MAG: hypothetical protein Ct9H300mP28_18120 [Pseudomonadota bacterium]|nr:MAG: hypothetical protein Ct9H300mP28_18120 [Pseudomonadota bacterium]
MAANILTRTLMPEITVLADTESIPFLIMTLWSSLLKLRYVLISINLKGGRIPDWFFEEGVVFLPEEIESGLRIPNPSLRKLFREVHGDLLEGLLLQKNQEELNSGKVPVYMFIQMVSD